MMWWSGNGGGGWWWLGAIFMLACMLMMVRMMGHGSHGSHRAHSHRPVANTPEHILAERLARGEIDVEEYRRRLAVLARVPDVDT